jgi:AAA domain
MGTRPQRGEGRRMTDPTGGFGDIGTGPRPKGKPNGTDPGPEVELTWATVRPITAIPPRKWAYGRFLLFGSAAVIGAVDGAGKGMIATAMALAMITGQPLLDEKVWRTGPVAIITYEDDQEEWERRFASACLHYQLDYETMMKSVAFLHKPGGRVTLAERTKDGLEFPDTARIVHFLQAHDFVLLIIDPFNSAHAMEDGNNNVAIAAVAQEVTTIARGGNVAALVLHHLRKGSTGNVDDLLGATSLRANFRCCRIFQVMDEGTAIGFDLPAAEAWRYLCVAGTKENYAPPPAERMWFHKESLDLNNPAGIYTHGDNVGAIERWTPPAAYQGMDHGKMKGVFDALAAQPHAKSKRAITIPWAGKPLINAGRSEAQATKILADWLQSATLIQGEPVEGAGRHPIQTVRPDPTKVAGILAGLAAAGGGTWAEGRPDA